MSPRPDRTVTIAWDGESEERLEQRLVFGVTVAS